jgi:carboxymethylenebutenolidase
VSEITFQCDGDTIRAWLETPAAAGPHGALVVIPDVRGVYDHYRDVARRFAGEGFVALVLDLYSREGAPDLPDLDAIFRWMRRLPDRRVLGDVRGAVAYLAARTDVRAVGVTGFCMGGQYTLMAACSVPGIVASVSWYGMLRYSELDEAKPESPLDMARRLACPYLGFFGADDALIPSRDVDELREILGATGKHCEIVVYPGAGHAFFNDTRPDAYRPAAAHDSWARAIEFFRRHLGAAAQPR